MDMTVKNAIMKRLIIIMSVFLTLAVFSGCDSHGDFDTVSFVILQTSDVHHHATGYGPQTDYTPLNSSDNDSVRGGYARLAGLIKSIRRQAGFSQPVLLFDSGDFLMGTIYDLTYSDPIAFNFFESMGYDAVTFGNHEFDWGPEKLAELIDEGKASGFEVPIIASNMVTDSTSSDDDDIEALVSDGTIVKSKIISIEGGVKLGILGIMGDSAESVAPLAPPVTFNHEDAFLQAKVDALSAAGADIIILLSHTGVDSDGDGEDTNIAESVTGIDIIASGHEHTATTSEFIKGASNTIIFSPGSYGAYLSRLDITYNKITRSIESHTFELIPVDDTVAGDEDMDDMVGSYDSVISTVLGDIGVNADTVISRTDFDLEKQSLEETGFGNLIADAIRAAASDLDKVDSEPYAVGIIASGVIRDNLYQGKTGLITFSDVYNALPLGISIFGDTDPGYPLMSVYVTPKELRNICEVSASVAPLLGGDYYLNISGIRYDYNASNPWLTRVTDVYMCNTSDTNTTTSGTLLDVTDDTTLYHIVVNLYALKMMGSATSVGLDIVPKYKDGRTVSSDDYGDIRIDMSADAGIQELKEWMAFKYFLEQYYPSSGAGIPSVIYSTNGTGMGRANAL